MSICIGPFPRSISLTDVCQTPRTLLQGILFLTATYSVFTSSSGLSCKVTVGLSVNLNLSEGVSEPPLLEALPAPLVSEPFLQGILTLLQGCPPCFPFHSCGASAPLPCLAIVPSLPACVVISNLQGHAFSRQSLQDWPGGFFQGFSPAMAGN